MSFRRTLLASLLPLAAAILTPAQAQQPSAPQVDTQQFQSWEVGCPKGGERQNCVMSQMVSNPDSNEPLMRAMVGHPAQADGPVMVFLLPLGVRLAPGIQLQVDANEPVGMPYQVCLQQGCRANLALSPQLLAQLRGGNKATVSAIAPDGKRLDMDLSLMGFTSASQRIAPQ
ncbi:invasion associated locus B family protein [Salinicola lusitanus]|uniref:Invasion associated locus B family protein n=1 Tax=Salinicola lusitanus TaxID=1949085 RepID=A0ABZ3CNS4_9GAMM